MLTVHAVGESSQARPRSVLAVIGARAACSGALRRLLRDEHGQDLLEYALLTAFVGLAGLVALNAMGAAIGEWYGESNTTVNDLWVSPDPGAGAGS